MTQFSLAGPLQKDTAFVRDLPLCRLLLMNDSRFPWCLLVPRLEGLREIHELAEEDQRQLLVESSRLSRAMLEIFSAGKMNIAALGNIVPQLHVHHVLRRESDSAWPGPVWGHGVAEPYPLERMQQIVAELKARC